MISQYLCLRRLPTKKFGEIRYLPGMDLYGAENQYSIVQYELYGSEQCNSANLDAGSPLTPA